MLLYLLLLIQHLSDATKRKTQAICDFIVRDVPFEVADAPQDPTPPPETFSVAV
jgi:hypothetical protein